MSIVVCKIPRAGLGNQLFPLMKAQVFAQLNRLPVIVTGYYQIKIGPYLRGEKNKRKYNGFFRFQKPLLLAIWERRKLLARHRNELLAEPVVANIGAKFLKDTWFVFSAMPNWVNYFDGLKENRALAIELFWKMIKPEIAVQVNALNAPCIGVHIRMGDFRALKEGEDFSTVGAVRTAENYFIDVINSIRELHGSSLPVAVFTDGHKKELASILSLQNVALVEGNSDLVDLLLLSRSKIIVTSAGSTFSYWSAFLSDAAVIMHPDHLHQSLRPDETNEKRYEGPLDFENELLLKNIKAIV